MSLSLAIPGDHSKKQGIRVSNKAQRARTFAKEAGVGSRGALPLLALLAMALAVTAVLGWNLSGGRLLVMETPSMCPNICVGSLVADQPLNGPLHVGELVTFHVPNNHGETYTHEISRIFSNGAIQTRGTANLGHDPWLITRSDIVGVVVFSVWELGWVLKTLPLLVVTVLFWVLARPWIGEGSRRSWDRSWMTVLVALPMWLLHPLVRASVISSAPVARHPHWASDTVVNSGVLPVSFHVVGGQSIHVASTHFGHVAGPLHSAGYVSLQEAVSLPWWALVVTVLGVLSPLAGCLWHIWRDNEEVTELTTLSELARTGVMGRSPLARPA